jgi:dihydrolipoamide dehydrogenase
MAYQEFDVFVIGGGPGGYTTAIRSSQLGLKTGIVERDRLGGVCLNWGCIPTKALLKNAEILQLFRKSEEWGISYDNLRVDFSKIIKRSRGVADRVSKGVEYLMKKNKIEVISGHARLAGEGRVEIKAEGREDLLVQARHIILATGARPRTLPGVAIDRKRVISSAEAMVLQEQPKSMLILGAGAIGIEFAYFYNALGTKVTVVEMMPGILPIEDRELTKLLEASLRKQGIEILTETKVQSVKVRADDVAVSVSFSEGKKELVADVALMAIGVQGNVENLGLEDLGVAVERSSIKVDKDYGPTCRAFMPSGM